MDRISHKAGRAAFGLSCVARFEQLAGVFASCGALHYAKILASLKYTSPIADGLAVSLATPGAKRAEQPRERQANGPVELCSEQPAAAG